MAIGSFLKRGKDVSKEMERVDKEIETRKNQVYRFWLKSGASTQITFLDGNLGDDGLLDCVAFHEHMIQRSGKWVNYPCVGDIEPCPLCEEGNTPSLVMAFTIIDHTVWTDKKDKTHKNERKLFVCKRDVYKILTTRAQKRGGLAGITFDVSRSGEKSPGTGNDFDFVEKTPLDQLQAFLKLPTPDLSQPFNYEEVIPQVSASDLRKLGFGRRTPSVIGGADTAALKGAKVDVEDEL